MILIITHKDDFTVDYVVDKLNRSSVPYFRFNCEDYLDYNIVLQYGETESAIINGNSNFKSVWYRRTKLPIIDVSNESDRVYLLGEIDAFLRNLLDVLPAKWLSNPVDVEKAENKFLQLSIAKNIGFNVPQTIITTDKDQLILFAKKNGKIVIKPIGKGRVNYKDNTSKLIFTNILSENVLTCIGDFEVTPAIYQVYIEKEYELRVTVVDKDVFAARIDSQSDEDTSVDWRRKKMKFEKYTLPDELRKKCLLLMEKLKISFAAFDLIKSTDGLYYFLEVNPNGQWVWIERDTDQKIAESIIKYLTC